MSVSKPFNLSWNIFQCYQKTSEIIQTIKLGETFWRDTFIFIFTTYIYFWVSQFSWILQISANRRWLSNVWRFCSSIFLHVKCSLLRNYYAIYNYSSAAISIVRIKRRDRNLPPLYFIRSPAGNVKTHKTFSFFPRYNAKAVFN